ncbi:MAG: AMP-binding protein [Gemmatirosa sp.]
MTDPLAVLPLAAAAGGGRLDTYDAAQLVAAGLTLLRRSAAVVRALQDRRSAILLPTSPAFLVALAASEGRGAVLVNPLAAPPEIAYQIADSDVGVVFTSTALAARVPAGVTLVLLDDAPRMARVVVDGTARDVALDSHQGDALDLVGSTDTEGRDEEAAIVYTSAMAGRPLGAVLTHRNLISNARATIEAAEITTAEHALAVLPFSHLFGLVVSGLAPLLAGGRVTTMERFHPIRAVDVMEREGVTLLVGVPAVFAALVQAIERGGGRLEAPALRLCICGGAPLPVALQERWHAVTGVELRQGYGLTEAGPVCLFNRVALPNRLGTMGVPLPGVEVAVRDPSDGAPLDVGREGEICVRGPNVSPGYVRDGALGLGRHGDWLRTGDLGRQRDDGAIEFRGLCKPMFTRNGFNIYPREIERTVLEMPGVRAATVRPIPEPSREHDIGLDVSGDVTVDAVREWCAERLSAYKQPSEVVIA